MHLARRDLGQKLPSQDTTKIKIERCHHILNTSYSCFKAVGCFWQNKNTISFLYTIPNCLEEQEYIILLWSTIQLSILVAKFHFVAEINSSLKISGGELEPPLPPPLLRVCCQYTKSSLVTTSLKDSESPRVKENLTSVGLYQQYCLHLAPKHIKKKLSFPISRLLCGSHTMYLTRECIRSILISSFRFRTFKITMSQRFTKIHFGGCFSETTVFSVCRLKANMEKKSPFS